MPLKFNGTNGYDGDKHGQKSTKTNPLAKEEDPEHIGDLL